MLFIGRPGDGISGSIGQEVAKHAVAEKLSRDAFDPANWHQSLSARYVDTPHLRDLLLQAGDSLQAEAVTIRLDHLQSAPNQRGRFNWELRGPSLEEDSLELLVESIKKAIRVMALPVTKATHRPHITISYGTDLALSREPIQPVEWAIDHIELVVGGGEAYGYTTLKRGALNPEPRRITQAPLF